MDSDTTASSRRLSLSSRHGVSRDAAKAISARKKVKCSGDAPCTYCSRRDLECKFPEPGKKRVYSVTRIQDLQERLARYESQGFGFTTEHVRENGPITTLTGPTESPNRPPTRATVQTPTDNATQVNAASTLLGLAFDQLTSPTPTNTLSRGNTSNAIQSSPGSAIPADSSLSSSHTFGSRLQSLLEHPRLGRRDHIKPPNHSASCATTLKPLDDGPPLPSEEEARKLFDSMTFFIGYTQHHIDTREFSDRLAFFYSNVGDASQTQTPWYLEMLLVFAIGKLFSGSFDGEEKSGLPGLSMFAYVQSKLPSLSELYGLGKLGIEVHALAAVYLQNANRKEEAYLYISSALRLATTHGYHRKSGTHHLLQSERVHLNRLWWTVYMQERRLAAATGNPSSILDDVIEVDMPTDSPGFPPALPLRTNIKIARVTGRILSTIYGPGTHPEETFVPNVQDIVQSLYWIAKEIPGELSPNSSDSPSVEGDVSLRTSAYLHMMLYQAILLTIRPVMLHVSKLIFDEESGSDLQLGASPLGRLSRTCSEAARRLLGVLMSLRKRNILTTFGFFDLDAIFSAAFIMILTLIIDSSCEESQKLAPRPGLPEALEILDYLVGRGNDFALQRAREVRRMRDHLSTFLDIPKNSPSEFRTNRPGTANTAAEGRPSSTMVVSATGDDGNEPQASQPGFPDPAGGSAERGGLTPSGRASQLGSRSLLDSSLWNDISYLWMQPAAATANDEAQSVEQTEGMADLLPEDAYDWNSIYHNQDLALTGQDLGDFGELERHILGFGG
ncbi:fungal specific transcription factor domain-containing protein [Colletotrichum tofieldiae]|uniref:Fungal specific transcription factor domain-containing protein n=1 Tax=Colletotrichum tofieldiae TaxID=708197 RepID=A0A161WB67_9PEZI|nr:fungal specific transcription factor domain-containing protein [Colletotrichum tofieldiae]